MSDECCARTRLECENESEEYQLMLRDQIKLRDIEIVQLEYLLKKAFGFLEYDRNKESSEPINALIIKLRERFEK